MFSVLYYLHDVLMCYIYDVFMYLWFSVGPAMFSGIGSILRFISCFQV